MVIKSKYEEFFKTNGPVSSINPQEEGLRGYTYK
jgi:hypothetical protein